MNVRELETLSDLCGAERAHGRAWRVAYDGLLPDAVIEAVTTPESEADLRDRYETVTDEAGCYLVAERDDEIAGYVRLRWGETKDFVGDDEAGLKEIYVDPDHWGEGVGTALLETAIDCVPEDREAVSLETLAENERGRAFYEARGFAFVETYAEDLGGEPIDHAIYRRDLGE